MSGVACLIYNYSGMGPLVLVLKSGGLSIMLSYCAGILQNVTTPNVVGLFALQKCDNLLMTGDFGKVACGVFVFVLSTCY